MICTAILFLSEGTWTAIGAAGSVVAAIAALVAVFQAIPALRLNAKSLQLTALDSVFKDIRQLEQALIEGSLDDGTKDRQLRAWCASFFNTIEYLCFLTNRKIVPQHEMREFFDSAIPIWWAQFRDYKARGLLVDTPSSFTELKLAAQRLNLPPAGQRTGGAPMDRDEENYEV